MYKVFIHDKPLEVIHINDSYQLEENYLILRYFGEHDVESSIFLLNNVPTLQKLILLAENPEEAFEAVKKNSK